MTKHTRISRADTGLPAAKPCGVLAPAVWNELHDFLTLALDALGERPEDFNPAFLRNAVIHQRLAIRISHGAMERLQVASA